EVRIGAAKPPSAATTARPMAFCSTARIAEQIVTTTSRASAAPCRPSSASTRTLAGRAWLRRGQGLAVRRQHGIAHRRGA
ncbi:hypothetical protein CJT55_31920, partial [Pseudomonas aeruginosa]